MPEDRPVSPGNSPHASRLKKVARFILHQWLLIAMGIACLLAYFFPSVGKHGGIIHAEYTILYGAVVLVFLISGMSIPHHKLVTHMLNWRLHFLVQGISYLLIPAIMVGLVHLIHATDTGHRIDTAVLAGYIIVACLPTTIASNVVMTRAAGGDDAAALVEVLVANILGPFITPGWAITLLPKSPDFDPWRDGSANMGALYRSVFKELGFTVLIPLAVGQILRWTWPERIARIVTKFYLAKVASSCLVLLVWTSFSTCFATNALESLTPETVILTVLLNIAFYLCLTYVCFFVSYPPSFLHTTRPVIRHILPRAPPGEVIAICFCGAAKTTGLGIPLLYAMYASSDLAMVAKTSVPVILYTTEQIFCAHFVVHLFKRWKGRVLEKEGVRQDGREVESVVLDDRRVRDAGSNA